jgi:hypothetical protein
VGGLHAIADAGLPARTAAQLLVDVQQARLDGLSGTVVQKSDLGLPDLPIAGASSGAGSSNLTSLLSARTRCGSGSPVPTRPGWPCWGRWESLM